jgi:HlyD family secretion protein
MKRGIVWGIVLLIAVAGGVFWWKRRAPEADAGPRFETAQVDRGRIVAKVTASGTLSALVTVQVGSQVSGRIQAIYVDYNATVKKDQVIARIDPQLFEAAVEQAKANLLAAKGNLTGAKIKADEAQLQFDRTRQLAERKLVAQADVDTARATAESAKATVEAAKGDVARMQAALNQAQINLAYTTIVSPINGTVISRNVDVGQTVAASLQAPTLFTIAEDLTRMQVDTSVAEADIGKLTPDMRASFTVDAFPGEQFQGKVRQIRNAPQNVQNVVTYDAVVDVANSELKLRPGMTANVTFVYAQRDDALRVPNAALRFHPPKDMSNGPPGVSGAPGSGGHSGDGSGRGAGAGGGDRHTAWAGRHGGAPGSEGAQAAASQGAPTIASEGAPGSGPADGGAAAPGGAGPRTGSEEGPSDRRTVWVLRNNQPVEVPIRVGITDGSFTEVVEGDLHAGDAVITDVGSGAGGPGGKRPSFGRFL